jgi:type II secretory pathway pseudopilin PulG
MKIPTPIITLIVGVALAASLLFASMTAVSAKKAAASASAAAAATTAATTAATATAAQPTASATTATATRSPSASPSPTASLGFVIPPHANYDGEVQGDEGMVAVVVHDNFAIAYFCNGSTQQAWFKGTPHDGKLSMTGKDNASLTANYALGHARGTVVVDGISHVFSIIAVHKPSGLFQSIAVVRGATIKAGWIVLANGMQVGSLEPNANAANPSAQAAPKLDISSLTAQYDGTTLVATPIDAETGSGF